MDESQILTEGFLEELNIYGIGIDTEDIHWRCSFSQGDGLSFDIKNMTLDEVITWLKAVLMNLESEEVQREKDPKQNGGILGIRYVQQLLENTEKLKKLNVINDFRLYTSLNHFATYYCHEKTRDINIEFTYTDQDNSLDNTAEDHFELIKEYFKNWYIEWCKKSAQIVYDYLAEEDGEEIVEVEESTMVKYLVINIYDLTFVRQIETDIPDDTIRNMDRDELEGTFDLDDNEELFTPNQLRTKIAELQRLLDKSKFETEDTYLLADYEDYEDNK